MKDEKLTLSMRFDRIIATILLVMFCVQIVPIEGYGVSYVKVVIMASTPFIFLFRTFFVTKALFWGIVFFCCASIFTKFVFWYALMLLIILSCFLFHFIICIKSFHPVFCHFDIIFNNVIWKCCVVNFW